MPGQGERKTVVTNELIKVRTKRSGSGWLTVVWDSFRGHLCYTEQATQSEDKELFS